MVVYEPYLQWVEVGGTKENFFTSNVQEIDKYLKSKRVQKIFMKWAALNAGSVMMEIGLLGEEAGVAIVPTNPLGGITVMILSASISVFGYVIIVDAILEMQWLINFGDSPEGDKNEEKRSN